MTQEGFKRKLTAILSADAVGYSRLMGDDEAATVRTLTSYRNVISSLIKQHNGTVIDSPGDNLLTEFASVVDAVQCAVVVQKELKARNDHLPKNRRMHFRIGINLGDVIEKEERIYGDGVNIAARLEGLAEPGGICISGIVYDQVENRLPFKYQYMGEQNVKNIPKPVGAYRIAMEPKITIDEIEEGKKPSPAMEPASLEKMAFPLPDNPSIAVLPFDNFSGDPNQEYIADGITENIIVSLSQIPEIFVIARNSVFTYKGKPVRMKQVSEELGVRYVLEGSVQKSGDRLRITAQLIDALNGHHLLAKRYDRDFKDLFALQDEITMKILTILEVKLTRGEAARRYETENLEAWGYAVRAFSLWERQTREDNTKARELIEQALKLDPDYAFALVVLVRIHIQEARMGWSKSPDESLKYALELAQKTVALDDSIPDAHALLGYIYVMQMQHEQAINEGERAIALGPNHAENHALLAHGLFYAGRFEEAIEHIKKAMRLSPYYPAWYLMYLADAYFFVRRYDESIAINKKLLDRARKGEFPIYTPHLALALNYMILGQGVKGRTHAAEVLKTNPSYSLKVLHSRHPFKNPADMELWIELLRKAGIPE
jgi:adenylate cyclase